MTRPTKQNTEQRRKIEALSKKRVADAVYELSQSDITHKQKRLLQMAIPALNKMMLQNYEHAADMSDQQILNALKNYLSLLEKRRLVKSSRSNKRSIVAYRAIFPCCSKWPGLPFCNSEC